MKNLLPDHLDLLKYESGTILDWGCSFTVSTREIAEIFGPNFKVVGIELSLDRLTGQDSKKSRVEDIHPIELKRLYEKESGHLSVCWRAKADGDYGAAVTTRYENLVSQINTAVALLG